ncbi:hypothetical protein BsWGS_27199 [Bradybaena similaris]
MGMHWGEMCKDIRGVIMFSLSPYEQKTFANAFTHGFPNMVRRFNGQILRVAPPFIVGYLIYDWANKEHDRLQRKDTQKCGGAE